MNLKKQFKLLEHVVYLVTNLLTDDYYIGCHKVDSNDDDDYLGSGIRIWLSVKKYGKENFKREYTKKWKKMNLGLKL